MAIRTWITAVSAVTYTSLQDLKGLKIGTVIGYVNTKEFDDADFLQKDPVKDDLTNFKKKSAMQTSSSRCSTLA